MRYLYDSSAIFRAIKENKIEALAGNHTLELARYEIGNILWKNHELLGKTTREELSNLARLVKEILNVMDIIQIECSEEEITSVAAEMKITFYDASYAYQANKNHLKLITEDAELLKKVNKYINASKLDGVSIEST
nr:type II toxin-antitoxin system VapC family toxin [Candidatus Njordarchaeota archaeon]